MGQSQCVTPASPEPGSGQSDESLPPLSTEFGSAGKKETFLAIFYRSRVQAGLELDVNGALALHNGRLLDLVVTFELSFLLPRWLFSYFSFFI